MIFTDTDKARTLIESGRLLTIDESFSLAGYCAGLLADSEGEVAGRDLLIRTLDRSEILPEATQLMWNDLTETYGLYPYSDPLRLEGSSRLRFEASRALYLDHIVLHSDQATLASWLRSGSNVVASAPTSFGKSLLIDEIVASRKHRNIVVIQPTLALLDETRKRFRKFDDYYNIVLATSQSPSTAKGNLFLFTAERVVEYHQFPQITFFVIDEFYKLSINREDDRAITLNQAFYKLLKHNAQFYLLGPPVGSIPSPADLPVCFEWFPSRFATVATDEIQLAPSRISIEDKRQLLFNTLKELQDQTIVYCAAPPSAIHLSGLYGKWKAANDPASDSIEPGLAAMIEWISDNISPDWTLIELLKRGIGAHHGALPRHLGSAIVDAFNSGLIKTLFCTSTLIEGVNTTAKNIILFDKKKGVKPIDFFDFRNIAGRSGRMFKHYVGRVYKFDDAPPEMELHVDFPVLTQTDAPLELLVTMNEDDLTVASRQKLKDFGFMPEALKEVLRKNGSLPIEGQLKILKAIEEHYTEWHPLLSWRSYPHYPQLAQVIQLAWDNLLRPRENRGSAKSARQLAFLTLRYSVTKSLQAIIKEEVNSTYMQELTPDYQKRTDNVVYQVLNMSRHWFDYKLPHHLIAISNLQEYVYGTKGMRAGDYSAYAARLENGFLVQQLSGLSEYGIPRSAILKIGQRFGNLQTVEEIIEALRHADLRAFKFSRYEQMKVEQAL